MKRIYQKDRIRKAVAQSKYRELLERLPVELFLIEYEAGEFIPVSEKNDPLIQIIVKGALSIYYIRDDGSTYSLAFSQKDEILGEMELFGEERTEGILTEVTQKLTCLAFFTEDTKEELLHDADFLRMIAEYLMNIIKVLTMQNAAQSSLDQRVYSYMYYKCEDRTLKGVEKAAFQLHCSPRHLQRILNAFVKDGVIKKTGKGTYELTE